MILSRAKRRVWFEVGQNLQHIFSKGPKPAAAIDIHLTGAFSLPWLFWRSITVTLTEMRDSDLTSA